MTDRRRFVRGFFVALILGLMNFFSMLGRPSFETIRTVDVVQLIATGMCFGAAIGALVLFLRSRASS